jgi:hypothetical protein
VKRFKSHHWFGYFFDKSMVLFDNIIQIFKLIMPHSIVGLSVMHQPLLQKLTLRNETQIDLGAWMKRMANFPVAYCGLKIITSLALRFPDFQRTYDVKLSNLCSLRNLDKYLFLI